MHSSAFLSCSCGVFWHSSCFPGAKLARSRHAPDGNWVRDSAVMEDEERGLSLAHYLTLSLKQDETPSKLLQQLYFTSLVVLLVL